MVSSKEITAIKMHCSDKCIRDFIDDTTSVNTTISSWSKEASLTLVMIWVQQT